MNYPYQDRFQLFLSQQGLAPLTIKTYDTTLAHFFTFLMSNRPEFATNPQLKSLTEADVRAFLTTLKEDEKITLSTYNKNLSHLNRYFRYLFTHQLISTYPTLTIHGKATNPNKRLTTKWITKLPEILQDDQIHFYTRLTLFLSNRGYTVSEFLAPGFEKVWNSLVPNNPVEKQFIANFNSFIKPIQELQNSPQLFLKQRFTSDNPGLSNAGLHKYLRQDETYLGFNLAPKFLHQAYILYELSHHPELSDLQLMERLRLDPASLLYYQKQLINHNK
ncbi:phage integrase N-terminal SAM-like domain-containing protein [Limosilactobacillus fastidiosus]|uniref:Phage integrase N-terminal SAM-like domain-containing protein n=1 Tax=Limosilactobacillus fastidiosus TaxID=2759855 RepID=A0A7W3U0N2_9LACO|nr:phage integrase N-terminal SAM-like domain-containing protein [Limosilactobacillus fastidiosus]MBB1062750.1 phage integrase N-terminal SAM-like domain-containing protein [Limosilactobacillus fastidiosus]MBB1086515.1 phage integrase N-terminal SAM-like domain-containing protein [Limosilactobacillus fastidiosus]MCD7084837.1 phage integrase N-terminal SAM-like domain-containing protein [Limosilactobacillus fastidiosus]MCD7085133.1 phage integrase N-terminal SAM-like domain-containing protein [L